MSNIPPLHVWTAVLVTVAFTAVSPVCAQTAAPQRGVQDVTPAPAAAPLPRPIGPYYALVIGNNNYRELNKLQTAINDAKAVAQLLHDGYGFQTKVLTDATRVDILDALDDYQSSLPENSNLLIYYAGHGLKEAAENRAYWLPVDAQKDHSPNWINAVEITDKLRAIPSRHILVIADSCWSGDLTMRSAKAGIAVHEQNAMLARLLSLKSRHIMSSGGDEPVADAGAVNHSVFAGALLQSLNDMQDDVFTAEALLSQRVQPRVAGRSQQTPQYAMIRDSNGDLGDFVFFRSKSSNGGPPAVKAESATGQETAPRQPSGSPASREPARLAPPPGVAIGSRPNDSPNVGGSVRAIGGVSESAPSAQLLAGKYSGLVKRMKGTMPLKPFSADLNLKVDAHLVSGDYRNAAGDQGVVTGTIDGNALDLKLVSSKLGECELKASLTVDLAKFSGVYSCSADGEHGTMELSRVDEKSPSQTPANSSPVNNSRFQIAGPADAEIVLDTKTGLMWTKNDYWNLERTFVTNWNDAMDWATRMNAAGYGGYKDWVVPTIAQYRTLTASRADREEYFQVFQKTAGRDFWASDTPGPSLASYVSFPQGYASSWQAAKAGLAHMRMSVRLVRIAQSK